MTRRRTWSDDDLRRALLGPPRAQSLLEITTRLGLRQGSRNNQTIRRHAERLGLTLPNGWYRNKGLTSTGDVSEGRKE